MEQILVISCSPELGAHARDRLFRRGLAFGSDRASAMLPSRDISPHVESRAPCEVLIGWNVDPHRDIVDEPSGRYAAVLSKQPYTTDGVAVTGGWLLAAAGQGGSRLSTLAPPFGGAYRESAGNPIHLITDVCGLRHLYVRQERSWAAASTSALLLALLDQAAIDDEAVLGFALAGNFDGIRTPFARVSKIRNGERASLQDGVVSLDRYLDEDMHPPGARDDELIREGADVLRDLMLAACSSHDQEPTLELSGGFDSRGLVAALPPDLRRKTTMLTLGTPGQGDWEVAKAITSGTGLAHVFIDLRRMNDLTPEQAWGRVVSSSSRHDASSMAVATAVLGWVEGRAPQSPRFNGINGEYARGRFYAGQRGGASTRRRVERLARWRVFANDAVDPWLFTSGVIEDARSSTIHRLNEEFAGYGSDWLRATDDHFLYGRMQRWCGVEFSASCIERSMLAPYFCYPFLVWSRRLSEDQKRSSRLFSAMIDYMDAGLASIPLATSLTPRQAAHPSISTKARQAVQFARRVSRKAKQRVSPGTDAPPVGARALADLAIIHLRDNPDILDPLSRAAWIDENAISSILNGARTPSTATVGFLSNLITIDAAINPGNTPSAT